MPLYEDAAALRLQDGGDAGVHAAAHGHHLVHGAGLVGDDLADVCGKLLEWKTREEQPKHEKIYAKSLQDLGPVPYGRRCPKYVGSNWGRRQRPS
ncbi:hypothetical protein ACFU8W_52105 [Streptomyces sp. NPDC057565]|uniref:hypothetical protein n=1 Tax=Streptomyces sp. NPDC057565 TaxID=3346169 RepID=UPI0036BA2029